MPALHPRLTLCDRGLPSSEGPGLPAPAASLSGVFPARSLGVKEVIFSLCYPRNYLVSVLPWCLVLPENVSLSLHTREWGRGVPKTFLCSHPGVSVRPLNEDQGALQEVLTPPSQRGLGTGRWLGVPD